MDRGKRGAPATHGANASKRHKKTIALVTYWTGHTVHTVRTTMPTTKTGDTCDTAQQLNLTTVGCLTHHAR